MYSQIAVACFLNETYSLNFQEKIGRFKILKLFRQHFGIYR